MQGNDPRRKDANLARNLALATLAGVIGALAYIELAANGLAVLSLIAVALVVVAMLMLWGLGAARRSQRARPHHYAWAAGALAGLTLVGLGLALWPRGRITLDVMDSASNAPLAGVPAELRGRGGVAARAPTDASGRAEFRGAPAGRYALAVGADQPTILEEDLPPWGRRAYSLALPPTPTPIPALETATQATATQPGAVSSAGEPAAPALAPSPSPTLACQQILVNGSFDGETAAWQFAPAGERAPTLCKSALALSQPCLLVLGDADLKREAYQAVTLPAGAQSAQLEFSYFLSSRYQESQRDRFQILLRDERSGAPILIIATFDNTTDTGQVYRHFSYTFDADEVAALRARQGVVELVFRVEQRERYNTSVYIDDVRWTVCVGE